MSDIVPARATGDVGRAKTMGRLIVPTSSRRPRKGAGSASGPELFMAGVIVGILLTVAAAPAHGLNQEDSRGPRFPDVLVVVVDTLRVDRLSAYGYDRPTSPEIDRLLERGVRFDGARTVEPLTGPASVSLLTSRFPHEHGASRNGLRMRPGMVSLPKLLAERGYRSGAFVGNWTLRDELTGLAEHFDTYEGVFSRKRWFGLFNSEADGRDLTDAALGWIREQREEQPRRPVFAWVQYVEPHAPYRFWEDLAPRLGIEFGRGAPESDRYDTEVAFSDRQVGRLLEGFTGERGPSEHTLVVFLADHGESLGEHDYWGHGRYLYDNSLRIPMGVTWPGRIGRGVIQEPALITDVAPTVLGLLSLPSPADAHGFDWSGVLLGDDEPPVRETYYEAHKGAVQGDHTSSRARIDGLLEVARIQGTRKEVLDLRDGSVRIYDVVEDPGENRNLADEGARPSAELELWLRTVREGLEATSDIPPAELDAAARERLRSLGYLE